MATRPYELLVRFGSVAGSVAGVSIRTITDLNGRDYESDPQPLSGVADPAFASFATQFAAAAVAERDAALVQVAALTAENVRLAALVPKPLGPREITAEEFFGRLSPQDVMAIMANKDPRVVLAVVRLFVRSEAIDLDSVILKGLIQGLVDSGVPFDATDLARIFA